MKERDIFIEALQKDSQREQAAYLDRVCADDPELRKRIEELLEEHKKQGRFILDSPPPGFAATMVQPSISEGPGTTIGRYRLLEQIGEGGFGIVFMAEQEEPVRRKVALKIIKPGMDTAEIIARFEAERQALALMDHPNIAKVLDAGATESGQPYFVMELVRGIAITEYCDRENLSTQQRLELFESVCRAVQHAHQKGIIHRDIKPSNVMVTMRDDVAVPKVIDFGVAKATNQRLTERTLFTRYAQLLGTPLYMSPEQAQMNELDVDTRSDIYSLGVLLYELLTGTTPFDQQRLREAAYDELLRIIRDEEPPRPSTRISTLRDDAATACTHRQTDPKHLHDLLRGDLDWIVMKSLEKDRTRRYESANGLALDIRRYLADEPVSACPPSAGYRFKKFARRNRTLLATLSLVGLVLVMASLFSTWQAIRAVRAERIAQRNLQNANAARREAETERRRAQFEARAADRARQHELNARKLADANLRKAREAVDRYFTLVSESTLLDRPDLEELRRELLQSAQEYYRAFAEQRADDPEMQAELVAAHFRIAQLSNAMGRADWLTSVRRGVEIAENLVSEDIDLSRNPSWRAGIIRLRQDETLAIVSSQEVLTLFRKAARIWEQFVQQNPDVPGLQNDLAVIYLVVGAEEENPLIAYGNFGRAREILESLVGNYPDEPGYRFRLAVLLHELSFGLKRAGDTKKAEEECRRSIDLLTILVSEFPDVPNYRNRLAEAEYHLSEILEGFGRAEESEELLRRAVGIRQELLDRFPSVPRYRGRLAACYRELGKLLARSGRHQEAAEIFRKQVALLEELIADESDLGATRLQLFHAHRWLGFRLQKLGKLDEARASFDQARSIVETLVAEFPAEHEYRSWLGVHYNDLAKLLDERGDTDEAEVLFSKSLTTLEQLAEEFPENDSYRRELQRAYFTISDRLIALYQSTADDAGQRAKASGRIADFVETCRHRIAEQPRDPTYYNALAWIVANTEGDIEEAIRLSRKAVELAKVGGASSKKQSGLLDTLAHCYFAHGDYAAAVEFQEQAVKLNPETESMRQALARFRGAQANKQREQD